jgi:hypothetical protein
MEKMIRTIIFFLLFGTFYTLHSQNLVSRLHAIGFSKITNIALEDSRYSEACELYLDQPLDHKNSIGKYFEQRIFVRHRGFDRPTVMVTEGYAADYAGYPGYDEELAEYLDANLVVVEHRFFGKSVPEPKQWEQLNLENATTDLHRINQILKTIYTGPWISTGISKGGQTTIYYRYFYPDDVLVSVPYVAPLNFSVADKRVFHFQDTVATESCRENLKAIQRDLLGRREVFQKMFADSSAARHLTFEKVGGIEKAFEYNVLELGFAYWQWYPINCADLPETGADAKEVFNAFIAAAGYDFFADQSIAGFEPFFYQALTEMGFYSYNTNDFDDLLQFVKNPGFNHALPDGIVVDYDNSLNKKVNRWLLKKGNNMLYVYGAYDAWASTAVQTGKRTNARKFLLAGGSHATRLRNFDETRRNEAIRLIKGWIGD